MWRAHEFDSREAMHMKVPCLAYLATLGLTIFSVLANAECVTQQAGFRALFDGKSTHGWHWSRSTFHGQNAKASAKSCVLVLERNPFGQGGLFMTDRKYHNFELYLEAKPDLYDNGGIFLRSTEGGSAYQIELAPPSGVTGMLIPELIGFGTPEFISPEPNFIDFSKPREIDRLWKNGEWNSMRVRITGDAPHVTVWINDVLLYELQMPANDKIAGETTGYIGLQTHMSRGIPGGGHPSMLGGLAEAKQRFRNILIKELP